MKEKKHCIEERSAGQLPPSSKRASCWTVAWPSCRAAASVMVDDIADDVQQPCGRARAGGLPSPTVGSYLAWTFTGFECPSEYG
jgi:hypothetical protein